MAPYWLYVGGDHFGERFLLFVLPMGIFAGLRFARRSPALVVFVVLALGSQLSLLARDARFSYSWDRYDFLITLGQHLEDNYPDTVLAAGAVGKLAFFGRSKVIDMRGLTNEHIAHLEVREFSNPGHDKIDPAYVLSRQPDLIAGWLDAGFDMNMGLDRETYESAGYRLKLVVNASRQRRAVNVVDIDDIDASELTRMWNEGFRFGVLEQIREGQPEESLALEP